MRTLHQEARYEEFRKGARRLAARGARPPYQGMGLKWQDSTVSLTLSPQNTLTGYVLDFFAVDGTVSLSLDAATATAASGKLTWAVASQPWQDGDHLMLRIRETGSTPILPPTPEPAPTPTSAPTATPAPTPTPRPTPTSAPGVSGIVTSLSPTPLTIAVGETAAFTLGVKPTFLGIRVEVNAAGDTGNLSLAGECPGAVDAAKTSFNGLTVELLGCAAGLVSVGLYQGQILWRDYTVTVLPAPTATATP